jgi:mono/diheme cytochrome c family protein
MSNSMFGRIVGGAAIAMALTGALAALGQGHASARSRSNGDPAAERGERIAARECALCHAIDKSSPSPRPSAPPFREIRLRYTAISLSREFVTIGQVGHYQMPPTSISRSDGEDLAAFIENLGR